MGFFDLPTIVRKLLEKEYLDNKAGSIENLHACGPKTQEG